MKLFLVIIILRLTKGGCTVVTADGAYIKKLNRNLILQKIIEHGFISRAELSKVTGLNKATISVQVVDLLNENLIRESHQDHYTVGRRPIMLSINGDAGYVLGIDLDYRQIKFRITNLQGEIIQTELINLNTEEYDNVLQILLTSIQKYKEQYATSRYGLVKTIIGINGVVNNDEVILELPIFHWNKKSLKADLENELDMDITIENAANLAAYAERVYNHPNCNNLLTLVLTPSIGAGIMVNGKLHKGYEGYAGDIGHMTILQDGSPCNCGNQGCWDLYAAEPTVYKRLSKKLHQTKLNDQEITRLLTEKNTIVYDEIKRFIKYLSIGLHNIITLYNPETLVINSNLLKLYPNAIQEMKTELRSSVSKCRDITLSNLGSDATVQGACALAIQRFLEVEEVVLTG